MINMQNIEKELSALIPLMERLRYTQRNTKPDLVVKSIDELLKALDAIISKYNVVNINDE